jgi:hypothetical protein
MNGKRKDEDQSRDRESESIRDQDQDQYQESSTPGAKRKSPLSNANTPKRPTKASQLPINNSFAINVVKFFLSPKALHLLENPKSDAPSSASNSAENDYFSLSLNPFEHVLCALILSKSLSHALGQRTVKMDLNSLYKLSNTKAMLKASKEEAPKPGGENGEGKSMIWQAIKKSHAQHQQRTVTELRGLAKTVKAEKWDEDVVKA